jgi:hypothetical protein
MEQGNEKEEIVTGDDIEKGWQLAFGLDLSYVVLQSTQRLHKIY